MGVRRISVGSSLARSAWTGFLRAAKAIAAEGSFEGFDGIVPYAELNEFFRDDCKKRASDGPRPAGRSFRWHGVLLDISVDARIAVRTGGAWSDVMEGLGVFHAVLLA
jgi:hypothetical protein